MIISSCSSAFHRLFSLQLLMVSETQCTIPTNISVLVLYKPFLLQDLLIEQDACCGHTISVQHPLEMHMYMHKIGHNQCKQCKPWWQIIIFNIVLIVQYICRGQQCRTLPVLAWKHWSACYNMLHHIPRSEYGRHCPGSKMSLLVCPLYTSMPCNTVEMRWTLTVNAFPMWTWRQEDMQA